MQVPVESNMLHIDRESCRGDALCVNICPVSCLRMRCLLYTSSSCTISLTVLPQRAQSISSVSANSHPSLSARARPSVVLPEPRIPTRKMTGIFPTAFMSWSSKEVVTIPSRLLTVKPVSYTHLDGLTMATTRDARTKLPKPILSRYCPGMTTPDFVPARGTFPAHF